MTTRPRCPYSGEVLWLKDWSYTEGVKDLRWTCGVCDCFGWDADRDLDEQLAEERQKHLDYLKEGKVDEQ